MPRKAWKSSGLQRRFHPEPLQQLSYCKKVVHCFTERFTLRRKPVAQEKRPRCSLCLKGKMCLIWFFCKRQLKYSINKKQTVLTSVNFSPPKIHNWKNPTQSVLMHKQVLSICQICRSFQWVTETKRPDFNSGNIPVNSKIIETFVKSLTCSNGGIPKMTEIST